MPDEIEPFEYEEDYESEIELLVPKTNVMWDGDDEDYKGDSEDYFLTTQPESNRV